MYYPNAARVQQFQANFLRKMANAGSPTEQKAQNQQVPQGNQDETIEDVSRRVQRERIKQVLKAYAPYVGGGLALGSVLGGLVGSRYNNTLAGGLIGGLGGAALAGAGKYAYDKYRQSQAPTGPVAVG